MPSQAGFGAGEAEYAVLPRNSNQALGIAQYAIDFLGGKYGDNVSARVYERVRLFHTDSVVCGVSALALKTNAPTILREEALEYSYPSGARVFGSLARSHPEKAIAANCAAVREWDANGTVFGFNPKLPEHRAGEFGHNDFYPVVVAAAHAGAKDVDGRKALRAMLCLDEIRGRLAEVFSLKSFKVDHVVHGAIASAAVYGALLGATAEQIESAIGLSVAHYIPWRAIRAGKQLSDSKGSSAGLAAEAAVLSMRRAMRGFVGPRDIFRNPESVFRAGVFRLLMENPVLYKEPSRIKSVTVTAYEPAFGVIGDVAKRDPQTRQSADHSMVYVISTLMRKAIEAEEIPPDLDGAWMALMLTPFDYSKEAIAHPTTRALMNNTHFKHGGPEYDAKYPEGIPTSVAVELSDGQTLEGPLVMFPAGHAANTEADLMKILSHKFRTMVAIAMEREDAEAFLAKLDNLPALSNEELQTLYYFPSLKSLAPID